MQSYLSEMLASERVADLRRDADRYRLTALARATSRVRRDRAGRRRRGLVARQPRRASV